MALLEVERVLTWLLVADIFREPESGGAKPKCHISIFPLSRWQKLQESSECLRFCLASLRESVELCCRENVLC